MSMHNCRIAEGNNIISVIDVNAVGIKLETFVRPPYRSILSVAQEKISFRAHPDVRTAIRFHRDVASSLHSPQE